MLTIVIQAGGESRRMGQNKALMPFLGSPLIERVVRRAAPAADELIINANKPELFTFLGFPVVTDLVPGIGALGGLYTAIYTAAGPLVCVLACDMPFVRVELIRAQVELLLRENVDVVIPNSGEGLEPLHAVYRRETCLPAIQKAVETGQRRLISWFPDVKVREMSADEAARFDPDLLSFTNINTPEEFEQAEQRAREMDQRSSSLG